MARSMHQLFLDFEHVEQTIEKLRQPGDFFVMLSQLYPDLFKQLPILLVSASKSHKGPNDQDTDLTGLRSVQHIRRHQGAVLRKSAGRLTTSSPATF